MRPTSRPGGASRTPCSNPDTDEVIGCAYIYPSADEDHDARVESWVRASRAELDSALVHAVSDWLDSDWPFSRVDYRSS